MGSADDKGRTFRLLVANILSDIVYGTLGPGTKGQLQRLFDNELEEMATSDPVDRIADDVFGNLPHGGE